MWTAYRFHICPRKRVLPDRIVLGTGSLVNLEIGRLPHLDLASTTLYDFYVVESNVLLAMESQSFHHLDGILDGKTSTNRIDRVAVSGADYAVNEQVSWYGKNSSYVCLAICTGGKPFTLCSSAKPC